MIEKSIEKSIGEVLLVRVLDVYILRISILVRQR